MKPYRKLLTVIAAGSLAGFSIIAEGVAQESAKPAATSVAAAPSPEQEAKFIATLTNATLKGRWRGVKDGQLSPEKDDTYSIVSVTKLGGDKWQINARMPYGGKVVELPIPAVVKWAGDTPVMIFDNVSMGANRAYSARVMIYEKTYSGWWTAPDHGGLISGAISNGTK